MLDAIAFDARDKHFFWCGHELASPVVMTSSTGRFMLNGIEATAPPPDTAGSEARLQRSLGHVPFISRLRKEGFSYMKAANRYGTAMAALMDSAVWIIGARPVADPRAAREAVRRILDPELVDTSAAIGLDEEHLTLSFWHGPMSRRLLDASTIAYVKAHGHPRMKPDPQGRMRAFKNSLDRPGPVLIIADETGETVFMGERAALLYEDIQAYIAEVKRTGERLPAPALRMIGERAVASIGTVALAGEKRSTREPVR